MIPLDAFLSLMFAAFLLGFAIVFVVLTLLMWAMQFVGAVLSRITQKEVQEKQ